ncbi:hypothetical protein VPHD479_0050 [Vibrio phage D479]
MINNIIAAISSPVTYFSSYDSTFQYTPISNRIG